MDRDGNVVYADWQWRGPLIGVPNLTNLTNSLRCAVNELHRLERERDELLARDGVDVAQVERATTIRALRLATMALQVAAAHDEPGLERSPTEAFRRLIAALQALDRGEGPGMLMPTDSGQPR